MCLGFCRRFSELTGAGAGIVGGNSDRSLTRGATCCDVVDSSYDVERNAARNPCAPVAVIVLTELCKKGSGLQCSAIMTQREAMLSGKWYEPWSEELQHDRDTARDLVERYNSSFSKDKAVRAGIIASLFGSIDKEHPPHLESPFYCDYGYNMHVGRDFYCNFACAILDGGKVTIGDRVLFGPNVHLYCPTHPLDPAKRNGLEGPEMCKPITIGNDVWVAGGVIILPGVTVGDGSTVGAGSVVTKDVEPYTVVAGNPARVIRKLDRPSTAT